MTSRAFWVRTAERAVKSFAQGVLLAIGAAEGFNAFDLDVERALGFGVGAALLSVATSIVSTGVGQDDSPSLVD